MPDSGREATGGGKVKHAAINAIRRPLNLLRRAGSGEKVPTASKTKRRASASDSVYESDGGQSSARPSESRDRSEADNHQFPDSLPSPVPSSLDSLHAQPPKLNSSSPASELPKTWAQWNWAYQNGMIDFDDPPPPPSDLWASDFVTASGTFKPPRPANEARRQRAVDNLGLLPSSPRGHSAQMPSPLSSQVDNAEQDGSDHGAVAAGMRSPTQRQAGPLHPALQQLAVEAKARFGVDATTVSLMDNDHQVFLGDSTCKFLEGTDRLERDSTCCAHTMLKASTTRTQEPLVVLDFSKDWRFRKNGFAPYDKGFYAAAPILVPAPLDDDEEEYPAGIFCLLGEKPRRSFDEQERRDLAQMAERASAEIRNYVDEQRRVRHGSLAQKQTNWRENDKVRKAALRRTSAGTPDQVAYTPPTPPGGEASLLAASMQEDADEARLTRSAEPLPPSRSAGSSKSPTRRVPSRPQTSHYPPIAFSPDVVTGWSGVRPSRTSLLDRDVLEALDVSTELLSASIEMDYSYVASIATGSAARTTSMAGGDVVQLLSSFGLSGPTPAFSPSAHGEAARARGGIVLYVRDPDSTSKDRLSRNPFTTGLVAHIASTGGREYVLGCFSQDTRRVLNAEDVDFAKSFARDLAQYFTGP